MKKIAIGSIVLFAVLAVLWVGAAARRTIPPNVSPTSSVLIPVESRTSPPGSRNSP